MRSAWFGLSRMSMLSMHWKSLRFTSRPQRPWLAATSVTTLVYPIGWGLIAHCRTNCPLHGLHSRPSVKGLHCKLILVAAGGINRNQISGFFFQSATDFNCCQIPSHQRARMERPGAAVSLNKSISIIDLGTASPEGFIPVIASAPTFRTVIQPWVLRALLIAFYWPMFLVHNSQRTPSPTYLWIRKFYPWPPLPTKPPGTSSSEVIAPVVRRSTWQTNAYISHGCQIRTPRVYDHGVLMRGKSFVHSNLSMDC